MVQDILEELSLAVVTGNHKQARKLAEESLKIGIAPRKTIMEGLMRGMKEVNSLFEKGEYFVSDVILSARAMDGALKVLLPVIESEGTKYIGKFVIGVAKGNVQDLGKNVVASMLRAAGFEVHDLGKDAPSEEFVKKAKEVNADIIGISVYTTPVRDKVVPEVLRLIKEAGLQGKVKTILGGASATQEYAEEIGIDAYAGDAIEAVEKAKVLIKELRRT